MPERRNVCSRCGADDVDTPPLCSGCYLQMAAVRAMETSRRLEFAAAIAEAKLATLN